MGLPASITEALKMSKRPFAVFDIDGTIFRFSLLIELVKVLVRNGIFSPDIEGQFKAQYEQWQNRIGSYDDYIDNVVRAFRAHIRGVELAVVMDAARQVVDEQGQRSYIYTRGLIKAYRSQGLFLAYVSHSPHAVVGEFARHFNFDAHQGTLYEVNEQGLLTGGLEDRNSFDKAEVLSRLVEEHNLDIEQSYAVGDTESDIQMLKLVTYPICFNPNHKLYKAAQDAGWPVVVERKDLILKVKKDKFVSSNRAVS